MYEELDGLTLAELVARLDELEKGRPPDGWELHEAALASEIERRANKLVTSHAPEQERRQFLRVACELPVELRSRTHSVMATARDLGTGGVFVETPEAFEVGDEVHVTIKSPEFGDRGVRVRGEIAWRDTSERAGVGVSFKNRPTAAHERRLRRFIIELLRHRVGQ